MASEAELATVCANLQLVNSNDVAAALLWLGRLAVIPVNIASLNKTGAYKTLNQACISYIHIHNVDGVQTWAKKSDVCFFNLLAAAKHTSDSQGYMHIYKYI